jgi:hypothetical protein
LRSKKKKLWFLFVFPRSVCYNILLCDNLTLIQAHWASQLKKRRKGNNEMEHSQTRLNRWHQVFSSCSPIPALSSTDTHRLYCTIYSQSLARSLSSYKERKTKQEKGGVILENVEQQKPKIRIRKAAAAL